MNKNFKDASAELSELMQAMMTLGFDVEEVRLTGNAPSGFSVCITVERHAYVEYSLGFDIIDQGEEVAFEFSKDGDLISRWALPEVEE